MAGFVKDAHSASIAMRVFVCVRNVKGKLSEYINELDLDYEDIVDELDEIVRLLSVPK